MKNSSETYKKVAEYCSCYAADCGCRPKAKNSAADSSRSCTNCRHFDKCGEFCDLDLYDKIVKDHGI